MTDKEDIINDFGKDIDASCKEQIIIDGVDVYNCGFIHPEISKTQCHIALAFSDQYEECTNCEQIEDCYFKQLARKTQECVELAKERDYLKQIVNSCPEVACENGGFCAIDIENKKLKQEYEELKDKLKIYEKMFDNSEFRIALTDIRTGERDIREQRDKRLTKENDRYRKALEEIEKLCKEILGNFLQYSQGSVNTSERILDIINKVKEEE